MNLTVERMTEHVQQLADAFNIVLVLHPFLPREVAGALVLYGRPSVVAPAIKDETGYAVVLHELGHHLSALGMCRGLVFKAPPGPGAHPRERHQYANLMLDEETAAWEWAQHYALDWTIAMEQTMLFAMETYRENKRRTR